MKKIAVIHGDGVGPEVTAAAVSVIESVTDVEIINADLGLGCLKRTGEYIPRCTLDVIDEADAVLLGTLTESDDRTSRNSMAGLMKHLDIYANVRPIYRLSQNIGIADVDMIVVKENIEGILSIAESEDLDGITMERRVSIKGCKRICKIARRIAEGQQRSKITCVHKTDILKASDGLFRDIFYEEMNGSSVLAEDSLTDCVAARMVTEPKAFDVIVTLNFYGDVISGIASAMTGGSYITPSGSIGDRKGVFEPMHGPCPELAGKNVINPISSILSASMMLDLLGEKDHSNVIKNAVKTAVRGNNRTIDLGGSLGTSEFAEKVAEICRNS